MMMIVAACGIGLEPPRQLEAVHAGQLEVHQDQARRERLEDPQRLLGVDRGPHLVALGGEDDLRQLEVLRVVVDDRGSAHPPWRPRAMRGPPARGWSDRRARGRIAENVLPAPGVLRHLDPAALRLDEALGQREAEAGALVASSPRWRRAAGTRRTACPDPRAAMPIAGVLDLDPEAVRRRAARSRTATAPASGVNLMAFDR